MSVQFMDVKQTAEYLNISVHGYGGARLAAPALPPGPLKPRGRVR